MKNAPCSTEERVLIVYGSPHTQGATAELLNALLTALPSSAIIDRLDCFDRRPLPCIDCRVCHAVEGCAFDDLDDVYRQLEAATLLVFATPVYNLSFPAPMKAVIDRLQRYWASRFIRGNRPPVATPKRTVLLTVSGADSEENGVMVEKQLKPVLTVLNAHLTHAVHYAGTDSGRDITPYLSLAARAAEELTRPPE